MSCFYDLLVQREQKITADVKRVDVWENKKEKRTWSDYRRNSGIVQTIWLFIRGKDGAKKLSNL